jgi:hypothetical protein
VKTVKSRLFTAGEACARRSRRPKRSDLADERTRELIHAEIDGELDEAQRA